MGYFFINQHLRLVDSHLPLCHISGPNLVQHVRLWYREDSPRKPMSTLVELKDLIWMFSQFLHKRFVVTQLNQQGQNLRLSKRKAPCESDLNPPSPPKKKKRPGLNKLRKWMPIELPQQKLPCLGIEYSPSNTPSPESSMEQTSQAALSPSSFPQGIAVGCIAGCIAQIECGSWCSNCDPFRNFFHTTLRLYPDVLLITGPLRGAMPKFTDPCVFECFMISRSFGRLLGKPVRWGKMMAGVKRKETSALVIC